MLLNLFTRKHIANMTDLELIEEIKSGKRRLAMGELYKRYSPLLFGVGLKYLKRKEEAEDILMLVFEKLDSKIIKSDIKNLKNWLYTIIKNECLMKLRKTNRLTADVETALLFKADDSANQLNEVKLKEQKYTTLEQAIVQLKDQQKQCIQLFYLKDKCYDEIVIETGFDLKKVKSYIQNGKRNLKLILENEHIFKS
jgi:RNA polymerase sigma factor (sigma-70 family)